MSPFTKGVDSNLRTMWPWEHAAIGYLAFSLCVNLLLRRSPSGREAVVVVFASVLPDLIDKPLGWQFGVFDSGYGVAHSVFFAVPLSLAVLLVAAAADRPLLGAAFGVGYLLHSPFDVVPVYLQEGSVPIERVLWPAMSAGGGDYEGGLAGTFVEYFRDYADQLLTDPSGYLLGVVALVAFTGLLWLYDGMPGLREPVVYVLGRR